MGLAIHGTIDLEPPMSSVRVRWLACAPLLIFVVMNVLSGCSPKRLRGSTTTVVDATIDELVAEREQLRELFAADIEQAASELAKGLIDGSLDALSEQDRREQIHTLSEQFVERVTQAAEQAGARLGPQIRGGLVQTVDEVMDEALASEHRRDAAALGQAVATATTRAFAQELEKGLDDNIVPALRRALDEELGPSLNSMLVDHVNPALAAAAHDMTAAALAELNRSLREDMRESLQLALFDPLEKSLQEGKETAQRWLVVLVGALAVLAILLAIILVWYRQKWVVSDDIAGRRREAVRLFAEAIGHASRQGTIEDYCQHVKTLGNQPDYARAYAELQEVLAANPRLKLPGRDRTT